MSCASRLSQVGPVGIAPVNGSRQSVRSGEERAASAEHARLAEATGRAETDLFTANPWYEWGPYLSERAWGTVREDYSAAGTPGGRSPTTTRGLAPTGGTRTGWPPSRTSATSSAWRSPCGTARTRSSRSGCSAWPGPEGNHGEDAKEYWWYLEGLPSHALLHWRYHYPQAAFPYGPLTAHGRGLQDPELELLDTGSSTTTGTGRSTSPTPRRRPPRC